MRHSPRNPKDPVGPNGLPHSQEAGRNGRWAIYPSVQPHRGPNTDALHDCVCHITVIRVIVRTDINPKRRPCGRQAGSLRFLLIVEGGRHTPEYLRTCHPQTRSRPAAAHVQCLVRLPSFLSLNFHRLTVKTIHQPVPTKAQPSKEVSVLVARLASPSERRPPDLRRRCALDRNRPRLHRDPGCRPRYSLAQNI